MTPVERHRPCEPAGGRAIVDVEGGCAISIRATPGAKRTEVAGLQPGAVRIRLQAPPVEGKANKALIAFLARTLNVRRRDIRIEVGEKHRDKRVRVNGLTARQAEDGLSA